MECKCTYGLSKLNLDSAKSTTENLLKCELRAKLFKLMSKYLQTQD